MHLLRVLRSLAIGLAMLSTGACASITTGTTQTLTVNTEPPGASCEMKRNNITLGIIKPTPGSIAVDKSKNAISVRCEMAEHEPASGTVASELQGMTFGNIIFGGLIGVAIDAGSGAMNKYPDSVTLVLPPSSFSSPEDRDAFYDALIAGVRRDADNVIKGIRDTCAQGTSDSCASDVKKIEDRRDSEIAALSIKRARARVPSG